MTSISISSSIKILPNYCFYDSPIREITIPKTLEMIKPYCFNKFPLLPKLKYEDDNVSVCGTKIFNNENHLISIDIPQSNIIINEKRFQNINNYTMENLYHFPLFLPHCLR